MRWTVSDGEEKTICGDPLNEELVEFVTNRLETYCGATLFTD